MEDIYGWRARIGVIYMASSIILEPEFVAMVPPGVSVHTTRIELPPVTVAGLDQMMGSPEVERCTALLAMAPLEVICFGGTSATFLHGLGWDAKIMDRMRAKAKGIPVTTTSSAVIRALRALGIRRVTLVTPYLSEVTERGRIFLEQSGFQVVASRGMELGEDHAIGAVTTEAVYRFVRETDRAESDGVFISCTNLRTVRAIEALERDLGKPVVSAIQASCWDCLRIAGVRQARPGSGKLLTVW